ncbi:tetratricopeptide repeat-containing sensor histidine kinase [Ferruginibacter sp.]
MKKEIKRFLFSCFVSCIALYTQAQTKYIDSIRQIIETSANDQEKLEHILIFSGQTVNPDTLLPYVMMAETITERSKNKFDRDRVAAVRANYYVRKNYIDSALLIVDRIIPLYKNDQQHQDFYVNILFLKSKILDRGNRYTLALTQLYEVLETAETLKDTLILIQAKTGIGWVQMEMEQYHEALPWLYKALYTSANKKYYKNYGALYSNIASTYNALGKADSAMLYINIAINDARENNNLLFLATALSMEAKIFIDNGQAHLAEAPLHEAVEIRKKLNDPFYTVYDMSSLASYYATNNQTEKGIELCKEGIQLAKQSGLSSQLLMIYRSLAENYKAAGKIAEYSTTLESIIALKDSFNNINSSKLLADMQFSSEAQKKEKTIVEQKLNLTVKNYWLFGSALFAVMAAMIVWLGFKNYNRKQNIKMELALAEEKRIATQSIIDAEEQERKRIAADLHDNIGAYASAIRADVEKISTAGFEKSNHALNNLQQHSQEIINSLRDTIWVLNKENITITGISDRLKNYINKLQPTYDAIHLVLNEDIEHDTRLSSQNALNIFRIIQEAIHNALKHSGANLITVTISSRENIRINITDNGKGLEAAIASGGNGMINMKARAKQTGMELLISSEKNHGTVLELLSNTTN